MVPTLLAGPCRLRALRASDAADWLAIITEPELRRLTSWSLTSLDEVRALILDLTTGPRASTTWRWAIELDERFIPADRIHARILMLRTAIPKRPPNATVDRPS